MKIKEKIEGWLTSIGTSVREYAWISPKDIPFSADVRADCERNFCGRYGKCWTCPPGCGDWESLRDMFRGYENAFVFTTCSPLEDSFDIEGMAEGRRLHADADDALAELLKGDDFRLAGAGSCNICKKCTYPDSPCRFPDRARSSMEACGMDVVTLSKIAGINYINGQNTVTYFSAVFFNE